MKIGIIHQKYALSGGMESYLFALLKGFAAQGDEVSLYVYHIDRRLDRVNPSFPRSMKRIPLSWLPRRWRRYVFWSTVNRQFDRHAFDLSISLTRSSCQSISVCGGTHLGMLHHTERRSLRNRWIHDAIETKFEQRMLRTVPAIMAHSQLIAEELKHYYHVNEKKISVLYPPINIEKFHPKGKQAIQAVRRKYHIRENHINFLFPSAGHKRKGLLELLKVFRQLPKHYRLYIAGTAPTQPLPDNVRYLGYVHDLAPVYASVNYTILPAHYEPFGLVVPESLACLTPVIVTKHLGAAELLSKKESIILPCNRADTLLNMLKHIPQRIRVEPGFAVKHQLTIEQHIDAVKAFNNRLN
jgi:glycosyltransferase involved in cell wall biosynthesis